MHDEVQENVNQGTLLGSKYVLSSLSEDFLKVLCNLYAHLYPDFADQICSGEVTIASVFKKYSYITRNKKKN